MISSHIVASSSSESQSKNFRLEDIFVDDSSKVFIRECLQDALLVRLKLAFLTDEHLKVFIIENFIKQICQKLIDKNLNFKPGFTFHRERLDKINQIAKIIGGELIKLSASKVAEDMLGSLHFANKRFSLGNLNKIYLQFAADANELLAHANMSKNIIKSHKQKWDDYCKSLGNEHLLQDLRFFRIFIAFAVIRLLLPVSIPATEEYLTAINCILLTVIIFTVLGRFYLKNDWSFFPKDALKKTHNIENFILNSTVRRLNIAEKNNERNLVYQLYNSIISNTDVTKPADFSIEILPTEIKSATVKRRNLPTHAIESTVIAPMPIRPVEENIVIANGDNTYIGLGAKRYFRWNSLELTKLHKHKNTLLADHIYQIAIKNPTIYAADSTREGIKEAGAAYKNKCDARIKSRSKLFNGYRTFLRKRPANVITEVFLENGAEVYSAKGYERK